LDIYQIFIFNTPYKLIINISYIYLNLKIYFDIEEIIIFNNNTIYL
jgi:hypothetical protein